MFAAFVAKATSVSHTMPKAMLWQVWFDADTSSLCQKKKSSIFRFLDSSDRVFKLFYINMSYLDWMTGLFQQQQKPHTRFRCANSFRASCANIESVAKGE